MHENKYNPVLVYFMYCIYCTYNFEVNKSCTKLICRKNIIYPLKNKNSKFNNQPGQLKSVGEGGVANGDNGTSVGGGSEDNNTTSNHNAVKASA